MFTTSISKNIKNFDIFKTSCSKEYCFDRVGVVLGENKLLLLNKNIVLIKKFKEKITINHSLFIYRR